MICPKPILASFLEAGKLIDTVKHFVGNFNWMLSCFWNYRLGPGFSISNISIGAPTLALRLTAGENVTIEEDEGALKISATGEGGGGITSGTVTSGSDSNVVGSVTIDQVNHSINITLDVYYS